MLLRLPSASASLAIGWALGLSFTCGSAHAQDPPGAQQAKGNKPKQEEKSLLQKAIEAANKDDFETALKLADEAMKAEPDNRQAMFIVGVMSGLIADGSTDKDKKVAMLRRSTAAFDMLKSKFKTLNPPEQAYAQKVMLNDAKALAIEGKTQQAAQAVVDLLAGGYDDFMAIERDKDLAKAREEPGYAAAMTKAVEKAVKAELAANETFPFAFDLKDVDGKSIKLDDYKGDVAIVDVWGTWCPPCRMEIPHFVDLVKKYESKGLKVVGINCNEEGSPAEVKKTIKDFIKETKINYPCVINDDKTEEKIPEFQGYPTTLFIDRAGKVRLKLVGYTPMVKLDAIVSTLLAEPAK